MVEALCSAGDDASAKEILETIDKAVASYTDGAEQFDDLTMLCLTYKG